MEVCYGCDFFDKQKTAYEMRISDWSSDVCSSDLAIPTAEENAKAKWADVQNQYQRRADLIPNLVATVRGYAEQEREVLVEVTNARARATSVNVSPEQLTDPAAVEQFSQAQGALSQSLGRLLLVVAR